MSEEIEIATIAPEPSSAALDPLFADLFGGSSADAKGAFHKYLTELDILFYLSVIQPRIHSYGRGRPSILIKIANASWTISPAKKHAGRFVVANPARWFDVHMEIELKPGISMLEVLIHHETSPHLTEGQLISLVDRDVAEQYRRHRKEFREEFGRLCKIDGLKLANQGYLVGKVVHNFAGKTTSAVSAWLTSSTDEIADAINWTIHRLDARTRFIADCETEVPEQDSAPAIIRENLEHDVPELTIPAGFVQQDGAPEVFVEFGGAAGLFSDFALVAQGEALPPQEAAVNAHADEEVAFPAEA
jgi:hypothetical protein